MSPQELAECISASGAIDLISTDVFDTLLLRTTRSARSRIRQAEHLFSRSLASRGWQIEPSLLITARAEAERLAFRALEAGRSGEVRLTDVIGRQLKLLGLPASEIATRLAIELDVEKKSLVPNRYLANVLLANRHAGRRIVAVSDTMLSAEDVRELIHHFYVPDLIGQIYTSSDCARTKRRGDLFPYVAEAESVSLGRILHIGDDVRADLANASVHGITAVHTPRPIWLSHLRKANGALALMRSALSSRTQFAKRPPAPLENAHAFGRFVLGPIVTQFCVRIWLYAAEVETHDRSALLFCARGGVGIREAFERVLARLSLPLGMRRGNFMVSRLVAARAAILTRSSAAVEELSREFRGRSFSDVASAIGGRRYSLPDRWNEPFAAGDFLDMLFHSSGEAVLSDIRQQNARFERHFSKLRNDTSRILLCDTGLYGSTQRLMASAFPALSIETIQFARANYKGHGEEHFPKVAGLLVERNCYSPLDIHSCVLRYWHLIESLFEPAIPSVRSFVEDGEDDVAANCGDIRYGFIDPGHRNDLLSGALGYVDELSIEGAVKASIDTELAWVRLKKAITRPTAEVLHCLDLPARSVDFGRPDVLNVFRPHQARPTLSRLASLRAELWREGAIAREFPVLKHALLPMLDSMHSVRAVIAR
ncbi:hydrolase [Bradyrhizobium sp. CB2312]|uniref:hydrolase n=1 Tax=Bradyrhizobium sp. CB2312 TaxID=3039155 RepID=UPI0024B1AB92|nr:hydrolase [Bradyrhizobium sp. CB2312]WFU69229.1 hydrolase [Bradyrhizobium sp. CB2312]